MIAALSLSVSAAGEYVPGNPRWSGYQNQVQWSLGLISAAAVIVYGISWNLSILFYQKKEL